MGLMDQLGQAVGGAMGGQSGQNPLLQALTGLLGQNSSVGGLAGIVPVLESSRRPVRPSCECGLWP